MNAAKLTRRFDEVRECARAADWRLHDVIVTPVSALASDDPPQV